MQTYRCSMGVIAMLAAILFVSCRLPKFTSRSLTPYGSRQVTHRAFIDPASIFPLPNGEILMVQNQYQRDIRLVRLNDTLGVVYDYQLPPGYMMPQIVGLMHRDNAVSLLTAEYHNRGEMIAIARRLEASTGKELGQDTIISMPRQVHPYYRSEFDITFSQDSSKALLYTFDLNTEESMPAMADAFLYDLGNGNVETMRFEIPITEELKEDAYLHYLPSQIAYQVLLANNGRAYFAFPGNGDSLALVSADFPRKTNRALSLQLRAGSCGWPTPRYCRPAICMDSQGDVWFSTVDYNDEKQATGVSIAKFSGASPAFDIISHYPIDTATLSESTLAEELTDTFIMPAIVPNEATGGCTVLLQREIGTTESWTRFRSASNPSGVDFSASRYAYGDIFGFAFDGNGKNIWGKMVASNAFYIRDMRGPFVSARVLNDSLLVSYLGYGTNHMTQLRSSIVSERTGTGTSSNIADMGMNTYADLRKSFLYDNDNWLIFANVTDRNSPELIHVRTVRK